MQHNHSGNNSDGLKHINCKKCVDGQSAFVQSLADDAVSIDGVDYLPVGKPNSYKDYELIYYINDVTDENEEVLVEYGANGTPTGTYEYGLQRLSVEYGNEAKEYYLYNATGNVTQTTAQNGSMFLRYTYDPFGNVESIHSPLTVDIDDLNRYTYNAEDYDYNTGLQYLRARYYDTSAGSFISQDTYLGQIISPLTRNRYTYANNSPVMYSDPSGHLITELLIIGTVLLVGGATTYFVADSKQDKAVEAYTAAEESYNSAISQLNEISSTIGSIKESAIDRLSVGESLDSVVPQTYAELQTQYAEYGKAYAKACISFDEMSVQADKIDSTGKWKKAGFGIGLIGLGFTAFSFAPALPAAVDSIAFSGLNVVQDTVIGDLIISGGMAVGTTTGLYGLNDVVDSATGYNAMLELLYNGDINAYSADEQRAIYASLLVTSLGAYGEYVNGQTQSVSSPQPTDQIADSKASSRILRENLKASGVDVPDYPNAAHHIVAGNAPQAEPAREILSKYGVDINDAANGVFLPTKPGLSEAAYHPVLHTNVYYSTVNSMLAEATSKQDVLEILQDISEQLTAGAFPK